jgi:hypothetical protein
MYSYRPNIVLGFHGCDETIRDSVVSGRSQLEPSTNEWDWLGSGIYFWEYNYERAIDFAEESKNKWHKIKNPSAVGAVISLGYCLDLLDKHNLDIVQKAYETLEKAISISKIDGLENKCTGHGIEKLIRKLDCYVINTIHEQNKKNGYRQYDSVRAVFIEGKELYPTAGFFQKNHIQICILNPNSIKGYFLPLTVNHTFPKI